MSTLQEHLDDLKRLKDKRGNPHWNGLVVNMVGGHLDDIIAALEAYLSPRSATRRMVTSEMVDRFLRWPLPTTVCADTCASMPNYKHQRSGTNLLNADESRKMLEFVLDEGSDRDGDRYRYLFTKGGLVAALSERFGFGGYEQTSKATIDAAIDDALLRRSDGGKQT